MRLSRPSRSSSGISHRKMPAPRRARNRGIKAASAEPIAFLDVGDLWPANLLGLLVETLKHNPEYQVVRGFAQLMALNKETGHFEYIGNPKESFPYYITSPQDSIADRRFNLSGCSAPTSNSSRIPIALPGPGRGG
jgi:hypothetical protein